jgi:hypothetical protein
LQEILQRAQFQKKKSVFDDTVPDFDCSGGMRLSDASDSEGEKVGSSTSQNSKKATSVLNSINATSGTSVDLKSVYENYQRIENDKANLMLCRQSENDSQKENLNIADLLALGEGTSEPTSTKKSSQKRKVRKEDDDSDSEDWEEVEGKRVKRPRYIKILKRYEFDG